MKLPPPSPEQILSKQFPTPNAVATVGNLIANVVEVEATREPAISHERLLEMLQGSTFGLDAYMPNLPARLRDTNSRQSIQSGFNTISNHGYMDQFSRNLQGGKSAFKLSQAGVNKLLSEGNSEFVVTYGLGFNMGQLRGDSAKPQEEAVAIEYQVLAGYRAQNAQDPRGNHELSEEAKSFRAKFGNRSNQDSQFFAIIVLPITDAHELIQAMREDPQLIREAVEMEVTELMGLSEEWQKKNYSIRPSYEEWHEETGGKDKMFLLDQAGGAQQPTNLEFSAQY